MDNLRKICKAYQIFPKRIKYLDRYFNNLNYMLNFIDKSIIDDKLFYVELLRAQMTVHEQLFFFYYGLSDFSSTKLRNIISSYHFFNEFPADELIDSSYKQFYDDNCFTKPVENTDQKTIDFAEE